MNEDEDREDGQEENPCDRCHKMGDPEEAGCSTCVYAY